MLSGRGHAPGGIVLSCIALISTLAMTSVALAGATTFAWTNANNSNGQFQWANGRNVGIENLYQDPTIVPAGFVFENPLNFGAIGGGGVGDGVTNTTSTTLTAQGLGTIDQIIIRESGIWSAGPGDDPNVIFTLQADISIQAVFPVSDFTALDFDGSLVFNPDGTWTAEGVLTPTAGPFIIGILSASNTLQVDGNAAPGSFFEKTAMTIIVPEPASALLLAVGFGSLMLRRSRRER